MPDKTITCCGALEKLHTLYPDSVYQAVQFDPETNRMPVRWMIRVYRSTSSGRPSGKGQGLMLNHCPCCGAALGEEPIDAE